MKIDHILTVLFLSLLLLGCNKETEESPIGNIAPVEPLTLGIPLPGQEILNTLGPENDIPIQNLLPDAIVALTGTPKQFLISPLGKGNELFFMTLLSQGMQLYGIDLTKIERFVQATALPMPVAVNVPDPQDPNAMPQQRIMQISRRTTIISFDAPIDKTVLFTKILNIEPVFLESRKITVGKYEYYDLTPPNIIIPQKIAVGILNDRNVIFVEGLEPDVQAVFSGITPKNAVLDRLKHTPLKNEDLIILASLEGQDISPQMLDMMTEQLGQAGYIPPNFIEIIRQHLRALSVSFSASASEGQPIITVNIEARNEQGAEAIHDALQGLIVNGQTTIIAMSEETKKTLLIPADFALSALNAMFVEKNGTKNRAVLNNFETLIPAVAGEIRNRQMLLLQEMLQQRRAEQLMMLAQIWAGYYEEQKKFPADIIDAQGKPLLSWRVALLPKLGLEDLYKKFNLNEPWDSETNKALLDSIPRIYQPLGSSVASPKTVVRFFGSPGTLFADKNLKAEDVKNPQTTLLFTSVTPQYAVEWTKPDVLELDINKIGEIVGAELFGITFSGQVCRIQLLPTDDPNFETQKKELDALIKGLPLPRTE